MISKIMLDKCAPSLFWSDWKKIYEVFFLFRKFIYPALPYPTLGGKNHITLAFHRWSISRQQYLWARFFRALGEVEWALQTHNRNARLISSLAWAGCSAQLGSIALSFFPLIFHFPLAILPSVSPLVLDSKLIRAAHSPRRQDSDAPTDGWAVQEVAHPDRRVDLLRENLYSHRQLIPAWAWRLHGILSNSRPRAWSW